MSEAEDGQSPLIAAAVAADRGGWLAGVKIAPGLSAELESPPEAVLAHPFPVFSPGDICPDNNLITRAGIRFLDFESAAVYSAFLNAAYVRMPFSTCWCVFRLPADLAALAELCRGLLAATEHWQAGELPLYPAFRSQTA